MSTQLEIQPRELKFVVELGKQSKCAVRLTNRTDHYVAFKVKTTSPKKYCVRPNVGVLQPNEVLEFVVILQAQKTGDIDLTCKDKFLIQSTIVPSGTLEAYITSDMFSRDGGNYVEENKLRVSLSTTRPSSPELTPINGTLIHTLAEERILPKTVENGDLKSVEERFLPKNVENGDLKPVETPEKLVLPKTVENEESNPVNYEYFKPVKKSVDYVLSKTVDNEEFKPVKTPVVSKIVNNEVLTPLKTVEAEPVQDMKFELVKIKSVKFEPAEVMISSEVKDVELEPKKQVELITKANGEEKVMEPRISISEDEKKLFKDVKEMKSKIHELEFKLSKAEEIILKLTAESHVAFQDRSSLQQEMAFVRKRKAERKLHSGFPLLFVCMVAIISLVAGYGFHP